MYLIVAGCQQPVVLSSFTVTFYAQRHRKRSIHIGKRRNVYTLIVTSALGLQSAITKLYSNMAYVFI